MNETSRFIRPLLEFFFPSASPETLTIYHGLIRKFAHFAEYAILGWFALRAFSGARSSRRFRYRFAISMFVVLTVALIDELNQSSLSSRSGSIYDVILDGLGGVTALSVLYLIEMARTRR